MNRELIGMSFLFLFCLAGVIFILFGFNSCYNYEADLRKKNQEAAMIQRREYCGDSTVKNIGGCNKWGSCGVMLSNGKTIVMGFPVIGHKCQ